MKIIKETPAPPAGPLYAGYWDTRNDFHVWRPKGTRDWQLLYTEAGHGLFHFDNKSYRTKTGDILLYQPGSPQKYGQPDPQGRWKHIWVHWMPRREVIGWLNWPTLSRGLHYLSLPPTLRSLVLKELSLIESALRTHIAYSESFATNALERALLFCARANQREGHPEWNARIQQAADYLADTLDEKHLLGETARRFGFSRTHFSELFRRQIGMTFGNYLEARRLTLARHLVLYTNHTLDQIAGRTGFSSSFYLSQRFKNYYGYSPRTLRCRDTS